MEEVNKQSRKIDYKNSKIFILEPKTQHPEEDIFYKDRVLVPVLMGLLITPISRKMHKS
jgi:hypothetical protein